MDREKFKAAMESSVKLTYKQSQNAVKQIAKTQTVDTNIIWAIEEMAELQQALIKHIRGFDNINDILQEMADVRIALEILQSPDIKGDKLVSRESLDKAIDVKLYRDVDRIGKKT